MGIEFKGFTVRENYAGDILIVVHKASLLEMINADNPKNEVIRAFAKKRHEPIIGARPRDAKEYKSKVYTHHLPFIFESEETTPTTSHTDTSPNSYKVEDELL